MKPVLFALVAVALVTRLLFAQQPDTPPDSDPPPDQREALEDLGVRLFLGAVGGSDDAGGMGVLLEVGRFIDGAIADGYFRSGVNEARRTGYFLDIAPDIEIRTGDESSFNAVIAKASANLVFFNTRDLNEGQDPPIVVVDWERWTHVVPIAFGIEADDRFTFVNTIAEVGYTPFLLNNALGDDYKLGLNPRAGVFLQAGGKWDTGGDARTGNAADESEEDTDGAILRLKADARVEIPLVRDALRRQINARLGATGWYDIAHGAWYDHYEAALLVELREHIELELKFEDGSGAPNFNEGEQFGIGLAISF